MKLIPLLCLLALAALMSSCSTTEKKLTLDLVDSTVGVLANHNQPARTTK